MCYLDLSVSTGLDWALEKWLCQFLILAFHFSSIGGNKFFGFFINLMLDFIALWMNGLVGFFVLFCLLFLRRAPRGINFFQSFIKCLAWLSCFCIRLFVEINGVNVWMNGFLQLLFFEGTRDTFLWFFINASTWLSCECMALSIFIVLGFGSACFHYACYDLELLYKPLRVPHSIIFFILKSLPAIDPTTEKSIRYRDILHRPFLLSEKQTNRTTCSFDSVIIKSVPRRSDRFSFCAKNLIHSAWILSIAD